MVVRHKLNDILLYNIQIHVYKIGRVETLRASFEVVSDPESPAESESEESSDSEASASNLRHAGGDRLRGCESLPSQRHFPMSPARRVQGSWVVGYGRLA